MKIDTMEIPESQTHAQLFYKIGNERFQCGDFHAAIESYSNGISNILDEQLITRDCDKDGMQLLYHFTVLYFYIEP